MRPGQMDFYILFVGPRRNDTTRATVIGCGPAADSRHPRARPGGIALALRAALPVVPVSVSGTANFLPKGCWVIRPSGRVKIVIDEPIETPHLTIADRDQLNERVRQRVIANFIEDY